LCLASPCRLLLLTAAAATLLQRLLPPAQGAAMHVAPQALLLLP
jgi:hypothetical protein